MTDPVNTPPADPGAAPPADPGAAPPAVINPFSVATDTWRTDALAAAGFEGESASKYTKLMERYTDPGSFFKAGLNAQEKIRSGQLESGLPKDATPEQLAEWRTANDVPTDAADYHAGLPAGVVLGETDKTIIDAVFTEALTHNIARPAMASIIGKFLSMREVEADAIATKHVSDSQQCESALKQVWGPGQLEVNKHIMNNFVNRMPEALREEFKSAVMPNGLAVLNSPEAWVFFVDMERELNPAASAMPNSANPVAGIATRLAELEKLMRDTRDSPGADNWYKNTAANEEYDRLLEAQSRMIK